MKLDKSSEIKSINSLYTAHIGIGMFRWRLAIEKKDIGLQNISVRQNLTLYFKLSIVKPKDLAEYISWA